MFFKSNLKFLRKRSGRSQRTLADELGISRSSLASYESTGIEPGISMLLKFSSFFRISLDKLIKTDLSQLSETVLDELEKGDFDFSGNKLRVLVTTLDSENRENIELVPQKASAGYTSGYSDPDYIKVLQTFNLPFLDRNRKYRTFPVSGDSMPPVGNGSWVTGEYVQNWHHIRDGYPYIIVSKNDGIVFKIIYNHIEGRKKIRLVSTNPLYDPYEMDVTEVLEVWKFVNYISGELPTEGYASREVMMNALQNAENSIKVIRNTLKTENPVGK